MKKSNYVLSLVFNILIVLMEGFALSNVMVGYLGQPQKMDWLNMADHFTTLSNALLAIAALVMIVAVLVGLKKGHLSKFALILKFVATVGVVITLIVSWSVLYPLSQDINMVVDYTGFLWLHTVAPIFALVSFLFFEREPRLHWAWSFLGLAYVLAYGIPVLILSLNGTLEPVYPFLEKTAPSFLPCVVGIPVGGFVVSLVLILLHNLRKKVKEEPAVAQEEKAEAAPAKSEPVKEQKEATPVAEKPVEESKPEELKKEDKPVEKKEERPAPKKAEKPAAKPAAKAAPKAEKKPEEKKPSPTTDKDAPRIYHVAKRDSDGKWQVKLANGEIAIKLFDTQAEAIAYADNLTKSQGGSVRVHSLKGKMRKK
jgi:hypothetical protein